MYVSWSKLSTLVDDWRLGIRQQIFSLAKYRCTWSFPLDRSFFSCKATAGASLQTLTTHRELYFCLPYPRCAIDAAAFIVILEVRLYAMYNNNKKILVPLMFLFVAEALAMGIVFGMPNQELIGTDSAETSHSGMWVATGWCWNSCLGTNSPFEGLYICADGDPLDGSRWIAYYWCTILIVESIFLSLSLYKAWQHLRTGAGGNLMQSITRDSVIYFVM